MSLMNGLSSAGSGLAGFAATAGLESQKADAAQALQASGGVIQGNLQTQKAGLDQAAAILADQLATARESSGRVQAGGIAATAAALEQAAAQKRTETTANADPAEVKLLRALGALPPSGGSSAPSSTVPPSPAAPTPSGTAPSSSSSQSTPAIDPDMKTRLIEKVMGLPLAGSDAAIRSAIAKDVGTDPNFKYKTAGQQAAEIENRLATAKGVMTDPASREVLARAIAGYQKAPLDQMALMKGGGPETMSRVLEINPDYQESRYPEVAKAMAGFGSGPQGDKTRFLNTGVQHLDVFDQAAAALKNNDPKMLNSLTNYFRDQFGVSAPNTFEGLKQIVGTEIEKAIAGGIGAVSDRDRLMKALSSANSPEQLQEMTNGFRSLMAGQLKGLKRQYEDATGFKTGPFAFENKLDPATVKALSDADTQHASSKPIPPTSTLSGAAASQNAEAGMADTSVAGPSHPPLPPGFRVIQ